MDNLIKFLFKIKHLAINKKIKFYFDIVKHFEDKFECQFLQICLIYGYKLSCLREFLKIRIQQINKIIFIRIYMYKIRKIILILILIQISLSIKLTTQLQISLSSQKKLTVQNAVGSVKYRVDNLPEGIVLDGDTLKIKDKAKIVDGYYPIRINAKDAQGSQDDELILLIVQKQKTILGQISTSSPPAQLLNNGANSNYLQQNNVQISNQPISGSNENMKSINSLKIQLNPNQKLNNNFVANIQKTASSNQIKLSNIRIDSLQSINIKNQLQNTIINNLNNSNNNQNISYISNNKNDISQNLSKNLNEKSIIYTNVNSDQITHNIQTPTPINNYGVSFEGISQSDINYLQQNPNFVNFANQYTNIKQISLSLDQGLDLPSNYMPILKQSQKSLNSTTFKNQISPEDAIIKSALQIQLNAVKDLANLLKLIRQATANKNSAQQQITKRTIFLNQAKTNLRENQLLIQKYKNNLSNLKKQLQSINSQNNGLRRAIEGSNIKINVIDLNKLSAKQKLSEIDKKYNMLTISIEDKNKQISKQGKYFEDVQKNCKNTDNQILDTNKLRRQLLANQTDLTTVKETLTKQVSEQVKEVQQLKKKLSEEQQKLKKKQNQLSSVSSNLNQLVYNIEAANKKIDSTLVEQRICQTKLEYQVKILDKIKLTDLKLLITQKTKQQNDLQSQNNKIVDYNKQQAQLDKQSKENQNKIQINNKKIVQVQNKIYAIQLATNKAESETNNFNDQTIKAQQNLDSANKRFLNQGNIIQQNTKKIQKARTQKTLADQAVDKLLKSNADLLAYSAAPQIKVEPVTIQNWSDFIKLQYGLQNSKPYFNGDIKTLYSFKNERSTQKSLSSNGINLNQQGIQKKNCNNFNDAIFGYIYKIETDKFGIVDQAGGKYNVEISSCSKLYSNKLEYSIGLGDIVLAKGTKIRNDSLDAANITFIRQW